MSDLAVEDVRAWVGSADFGVSRAFYTALGCTTVWTDGAQLALLELGPNRFYLQNYYVAEWLENTMLTISVESARAWFDHVHAVLADGQFGSARVAEPVEESWGATVTYVWDPSGALLHLTEWNR